YKIGSHAVACFKVQPKLKYFVYFITEIDDFKFGQSAAPLLHIYHGGLSLLADLHFKCRKKCLKLFHRTFPLEMYLTNLCGPFYFRMKTAFVQPKFCCSRCSSNNRTFFNHHWDSVKLAVD